MIVKTNRVYESAVMKLLGSMPGSLQVTIAPTARPSLSCAACVECAVVPSWRAVTSGVARSILARWDRTGDFVAGESQARRQPGPRREWRADSSPGEFPPRTLTR